MSKVRGFVVVA